MISKHGVSKYHMSLRLSLVVIAIVLLFDSGVAIPATRALSENTQAYLAAAVGITGAGSINYFDVREGIIGKRKDSTVAIIINDADTGFSTYLLSIILFMLLVLVVLNYTLDFARELRRPNV